MMMMMTMMMMMSVSCTCGSVKSATAYLLFWIDSMLQQFSLLINIAVTLLNQTFTTSFKLIHIMIHTNLGCNFVNFLEYEN